MNSSAMKISDYLLFFFDNYLDMLAVALPLLVILFLGRRLHFSGKWPIVFFYLIYFISGCLSSYFNIVDNTYFHLTPLFFSIPLYFAFHSLLQSKLILKISFAALVTMYVINRKYIVDYFFNAQFQLYFNFFILFITVAYLFQELDKEGEEIFSNKIEFWLSICLLFFAVSSTFFYSFVQYTIGYATTEYELLTHMYGICQSTPLFISGLFFSIMIIKYKNQSI